MKEKDETEQVAAALPIDDEDAEVDGREGNGLAPAAESRESMIYSGTAAADTADDDDDSDDEGSLSPSRPKTSKLKALGAVAGFAVGLILLATGVSWFFGMGVFAQTKKQNVDRTSKTVGGATSAPVSEDEKLRMALNMVAEKAAANASSSPLPVNASNQRPGSISPNEKGPEPPSLALPGETIPITPVPGAASKSDAPSQRMSSGVGGGGGGGGGGRSSTNSTSSSRSSVPASPSRSIAPVRSPSEQPVSVRSIYFGPSAVDREEPAEDEGNDDAAPAAPIIRSKPDVPSAEPVQLPFGTFLPVRILGAIYAVQNSGSLVRMELTQAVETGTEGVELPAGTVVVGRVKGSELNRILVSVVGLIDPATGGLVSFDGELVGGDGAAGIAGKRRSVKSGWSKLFAGLREAGSTAIGALGGIRRGGGGTVVIADRAAGSMGADVAEMIRRDRVSEYVEIPAGTNAFVLVTELPREVSETFRASSSANVK